MADKEAERIKYETEVLKATVLVTVATTGGSIGLLLGEHTLLRLGLAGVGVLVTLVLIAGIWRLDRRIRKLIEEVKERV
jgi:membrane protein DedA with SNARE-associated domain